MLLSLLYKEQALLNMLLTHKYLKEKLIWFFCLFMKDNKFAFVNIPPPQTNKQTNKQTNLIYTF